LNKLTRRWLKLTPPGAQSVNQEELGWECTELRTTIDSLKQEKIQVLIDRKAAVVTEQKKIQDYCLGHRKRLRVLRMNLEGALNEIGAWCLSYPRKGSTIGEVIAWFEKEIQALPDVIAKANKNFLVYCLIGVLKMLQGHAECITSMG
jgi:hypothetical protein